VKLTKIIPITLFALLLMGTSVFGWIFFYRLSLPYNSEGRYFDEEKSLVYHQQVVWVYAIIFFLLLVISCGITILRIRAKGGNS
jgi:hypothetical protein